MGIVVVPSFGTDPATITAAGLDAKVDGLASEFNGHIDADNLDPSLKIPYSMLTLTGQIVAADMSASAAIPDSALATITTAGKVNTSALVTTSQATGDMLYASSASAWSRLGKGTASYYLRMKSDGTAPEWAVADSASLPAGTISQVVNTQTGALATVDKASTIPDDDTIPQKTEGTELMTLSITPTSATNKLKIDVVVNGYLANDILCVALFQDTTDGALAAARDTRYSTISNNCKFTHYMTSGTTSATTFKVRAGMPAGCLADFFFNGGNGGRKLGGVYASSITITEIKV